MPTARTKNDLIIDTWEKLDCESVGAAELTAIAKAVEESFGRSAVDSPMITARLLADEGAELRHSEVMALYIQWASDRPYDAALRNIFQFADVNSAASSIRNAENLRRKWTEENDREGLRLLRELALAAKKKLAAAARSDRADQQKVKLAAELNEWLAVWLSTPEIFDQWLSLRRRSPAFKEKFGLSENEK